VALQGHDITSWFQIWCKYRYPVRWWLISVFTARCYA